MKQGEFVSLLVGIFIIILFVVYGVFTDLLNSFISGFGFWYGLILGGILCLLIALFLLSGGKKK